MNKILKPLILFGVGGLAYTLMEMLWRGRTYFSMFLVGGICFLAIGALNEVYTYDMSLLLQMTVSAVMITAIELVAGLIINRGYSIWDYRDMPLNIAGQICLPYMALWWLLSLVAILLDDWLRYRFFGEEKPRYKLV